MRSTLFLFLAQKRLFWKAKVVFARLAFSGYRGLFGIRHRFREEGTTTKSLLSLLRLTLGDLVLALSLAAGLQISNPYLAPWFTNQGFTIPTESDYGTLLAAVISGGAVFIGLYYAAISAIGGAIYARVPNNIRELLAQERVGSAYMRFLAVFTYFGVCLLAFHSAGLKPVVSAVPLVLLGAGLAIIGFVRLGARAFYLFDPTSLSSRLFEQLQRCHAQVQAGSYRWSDQSFQRHAYGRARDAVDTLAAVSGITAQETHLNGRPFAGLCANLLLFLCRYETVKKSIPTDSLWYEQRYVHSDWYRTDDTATSIAHQTATGLQPRSVSDPKWVESAILPIVQRCLELNAKARRYDIVNDLLNYLDAYAQQLAKERQVEPALDLIRDVFSWCEALIFATGDGTADEESLEHIGICGQIAGMPVNVLLAYVRTIESDGRDAVRQRIRQITWKSEKSIYKTGFAVHVLKQLEWLRPRLEFEERVEGHVISPLWYLQELITQAEAENHAAAMICFHNEACKLYERWIKTAISSQHPWLAAMMISRESEYWHKLAYHMAAMNQLWNDLNSDRRLEELSWPSVASDDLTRKRQQRETELLKLMSVQSVRLSLISSSRPDSFPDFAGQFLHTIGEAVFSAMCRNDCDTVELLFKSYFDGSLLQFDRLRPQETGSDWQRQTDIKVAVAPLLDLMDISGYAYFLSDYHGTPHLQELIANTWDEYLKQDAANRIQFLAEAVSLTESAFEIAHRGVNRTRWKQILEQRLKNVERREVAWDIDGPFRNFDSDIKHKSPLVRIFARDIAMTLYDGIDVFLYEVHSPTKRGKGYEFRRGSV